MSGTGRAIADDILAEQRTRSKGHRTRWQARVEGRDGRTLAKAHGRSKRAQRHEQESDAMLRDYARAGLRVR